jgi:hypothetical protein
MRLAAAWVSLFERPLAGSWNCCGRDGSEGHADKEVRLMNKALIVGGAGVALGAVLLGKRLAAKRGELSVEKMLERMPDTSPRKWLFLNITAIRENTDQILERLAERDYVPAPDDHEGVVT